MKKRIAITEITAGKHWVFKCPYCNSKDESFEDPEYEVDIQCVHCGKWINIDHKREETEEKRAALVEADRNFLSTYKTNVEDSINCITIPDPNTVEAIKIVREFKSEITEAINKFEKSLTELA